MADERGPHETGSVDVFRYHEISEATRRILNPLSEDKQALVLELCGLHEGQRQLDLACGKGELLCQAAARYGVVGRGVDLSEPFLADARRRAAELGVGHLVEFVHADAAESATDPPVDLVSCIGATWIGGGLSGTIELMGRSASPDAWLLVGEVFWKAPPPPAFRAREEERQAFFDLVGTLDVIEKAGCELVEMVLANDDDWDRYSASQWLAVRDWVSSHRDDPAADAFRRTAAASRRDYLEIGRSCMGWGVFVLRRAA